MADSKQLLKVDAAANGHQPQPTQKTNSQMLNLASDVQEYLLTAGAHDAGNADCVKYLFGDKIGYSDALGWVVDRGSFWDTSQGKERVRLLVESTLKWRALVAVNEATQENPHKKLLNVTVLSARNINNALNLLAGRVEVSPAEFDNDPNVINTKSGVVHLPTGQIVGRDAGQKFTYCIDTEFSSEAESYEWMKFLCESVADDERRTVVDFLQESLGYSLTGHNREECAFYVYGPRRSGKGTLQNTIMSLLGKPLVDGLNFKVLTRASSDRDGQNFLLAGLRPSRIVFTSESGKRAKLDAALLKQLTGNDPVRCSHKHKEPFTYIPKYSIWMTSNWQPNTDPDDDAAWGRLHVFEFPHSHYGSEDKKLKERLRTRENRRGILAWMVAGAKRWYESERGLVAPNRLVKLRQDARMAVDSVGRFVDEHMHVQLPTLRGAENFIPSSQVHKLYSQWCKLEGFEYPVKLPNFSKAMTSRYGARVDRTHTSGKLTRVIYGIAYQDGITPGMYDLDILDLEN